MTIHVTQADIDAAVQWANGLQNESVTECCPVAQALRRILGTIVTVGYSTFQMCSFVQSCNDTQSPIYTVLPAPVVN